MPVKCRGSRVGDDLQDEFTDLQLSKTVAKLVAVIGFSSARTLSS